MHPRTPYQREYTKNHQEERRGYERKWREKHREQIRMKSRRWTAWLNILRREQGCTDCGSHDKRLLYHHLEPSAKKKNIAKMHSMSIESFLNELTLCTVLCYSCHRHRHETMKGHG